MSRSAVMPGTLDRDALTMLRRSSTIVFRHHHGETTIEGKSESGRGKASREVVVPVGHRFEDYSPPEIEDPTENASCFEMFHSNRPGSVIATFLASLRPGDQVEVVWLRGNDTETLRKAGLHCDELLAQVRRGKHTLRHLLEVSTCPDNSARMIRRGHSW